MDANKITPQDAEKLLPKTWELDLKTGALTLPVGTKATLQSLPLQLLSHVTLATVSNLGAGFGIGGGGTPLIEKAQRSLAGENMADFVLSQDVFIEESLKMKEVQQVVYNANGTFHVLYRGKIYTIVPHFNITSREVTTDETIDPSIVLNDNDTLTYTIAIDVVEELEVEEEENRRFRRRRTRSVLIFEPFIEPDTEDLLCRKLFPGKTVCDF